MGSPGGSLTAHIHCRGLTTLIGRVDGQDIRGVRLQALTHVYTVQYKCCIHISLVCLSDCQMFAYLSVFECFCLSVCKMSLLVCLMSTSVCVSNVCLFLSAYLTVCRPMPSVCLFCLFGDACISVCLKM